MASIVPGYEYDIFISYRQKDNKGDRWVSEFVDDLKTELESTFKEEISVYFDINPHDGLLETHDVNASLKEKLKCLIFIPIISRTYCDPKSFAWEHEFKPFVEQASHDQFGLKVKLPSGNVASRILPIQIHDLTAEDKALLESDLEGVLRAIEFVYKEPGVNRPLTANDDKEINLNKTKYRNQINKVANAIYEVIHSLNGAQTTQAGRNLPFDHPIIEIKVEDKSKELSRTAIFNKKSKKWLIMLISFFLSVVGAFVIYKIIDSGNQTQDLTKLEKSIAVLPFINDSHDEENTYFINGIMDEVLNNLQKIKDFRVLSRTSAEKYRGSTKFSIPEIAKALDANYIVEGSGQKYGNTFRLRVQLIAAKNEKHLWAESYEQEIKDTKDIFKIQSQIAQTIASELKATITPDEKQLIEKTSTTNLTAYDFYQRGRAEHTKYWIDNGNRAALKKAEDFYHKALEYDSTFAQAYTGLARVFWDKHYWEEYFSENYMDSVLFLCDIALSFDKQLAEAYTVKGQYFHIKGNINKAIDEYDKALKINPNSWEAYSGKGYLYENDDQLMTIENLQKAASLNHGPEFVSLIRRLSEAYDRSGFIEEAKNYNAEALKLNGDSIEYLLSSGRIEWHQGNFKKATEFLGKGYLINSNRSEILNNLAYSYLFAGQYKESLNYYIKYLERLTTLGQFDLHNMHRIGYAYWENGYKKEAEYYFDKQIEYSYNLIKSDRPFAQLFYTYYDLAGVYAFRGDRDKAYENLRIFNRREIIPLWMPTLIKTDPLFDKIRNEPEFQQIVRDVESKYQAEHERVRKWLTEQGKL
jgi:TolB-like protein/tetratricopeptide (TPR) repeat protein